MTLQPARIMIRGAEVVTAANSFRADVLVSDGTITAIGSDLTDTTCTVIDAAGCYLLPGGIDAHTHLDFAPGAFRTADDFTTGTAAAVLGGTTCVLDFALTETGGSLGHALDRRLRDIEAHLPYADVGLHLILREMPPDDADEQIAAVIARGICDFKLYLAHRGEVMIDDDVAYRWLRVLADHQALAMIHAENGYVIDARRDMLCAEGQTGPLFHAESRPPSTEIEAVNRAIFLSQLTGASVYIVHVSSAGAADLVASARAAGVRVDAETCAQYLLLDNSILGEPDGWQYIFAPPARGAEDRERLWQGLATGAISTVASDHSPYMRQDKDVSRHRDFRSVPNGIPGIQERLLLMYEHGVRSGRISMNRLVEVFSTNPARLFGLLPRKGTISVGADADLVIFDPRTPTLISSQTMASRCDFNAYENTVVSGSVRTVLLRGTVVVDSGVLSDDPSGRFVERTSSESPHDFTRCPPAAPCGDHVE